MLTITLAGSAVFVRRTARCQRAIHAEHVGNVQHDKQYKLFERSLARLSRFESLPLTSTNGGDPPQLHKDQVMMRVMESQGRRVQLDLAPQILRLDVPEYLGIGARQDEGLGDPGMG